MAAEDIDPQFESLLEHLRAKRGFDFTGYKRASLQRRVLKRMQDVGAASFADYRAHLDRQPEEFSELFNTILINVTSFFRNPAAWEALVEQAFPRVLEARPEGEPIRVWCAACASGQETYTLAMLLAETLGVESFGRRVKIYATDLDEDALTQARQATYTARDLETVPAALREKYFEPAAGGRMAFRSDLRRSIIFGGHNLVTDAAISKLDLLICRNTLMYFNAEARARILGHFHFALRRPGFLFLGKAEMLVAHAELFEPVDLRNRIFAKVPRETLRERAGLRPEHARQRRTAAAADPNGRLLELAFETQPEAQIVLDRRGTLAFADALAREEFGLTAGDIGRPLQDLELSYRPIELRSLIDQAYAHRRRIEVASVERRRGDDEPQFFDISVVPVAEDGEPLGASVTFHDVTRYQQLQGGLLQANQELETALEELQSANEELETTNEELQSTVEELETANEELQSANEEMETMNEELQAANQELEAINSELHDRSERLDRAHASLEAILRSLRAGVAVVDREMNVVNWDGRAEDLWGVRAQEAEGRKLAELDIGLPVGELTTRIRASIDGDGETAPIVVEAVNRRGRPIRCRVTCSPLAYRYKSADGAVLLMEEWRGSDGQDGRDGQDGQDGR